MTVLRCNDCEFCDDCGTRENLCYYTDGLLCDQCHKKKVKKRIETFNEDDARNTDEIICPYCGYELSESYEFSDHGKYNCPDCENEFEYSRYIEVNYSTNKISVPVPKKPSGNVFVD